MNSELPVFNARPSDPEFFQDPYPHYQKMHSLGPAFVWQDYNLVCFARHHLVNALLRDRRLGREITHIVSREDARLPPIPDHLKRFYAFESNSMLEREPPVHTRLRKLVNRAFVSRNIELLAPEIEALCHKLIDGFQDRNELDLLPTYAEIIPVVVIARLLGIPNEMSDQLLDWSHKMVAMYQFNRSRPTEDVAEKATVEFSNYILEIAQHRKSNPKDDLISALANVEGDNLSEDELVATCILLLNAGHEATVHAIGNSIHSLLKNNIDTSELFATEASTDAAIEELLRHDPPLHLFTRFVLQDLEIEGVKLGKGQSVGLLLSAANHDPEVFENPSKLEFARKTSSANGHLSFGAGIHFCLGAPLARLEMKIALPILFSRLPNLRLAGPQQYADRHHFRGLQQLKATT